MAFSIFNNLERQLRNLLDNLQKHQWAEPERTQRIVDFFGPMLRDIIKKIAPREQTYTEKLTQIVFNEWIEIIDSQLLTTNNSFVEQHKAILTRLVELCIWKQQIARLSEAEVARLANAPVGSVSAYLAPQPASAYTKELWQILNHDEQTEVEYRTLRVVLALAKIKPRSSIFAFHQSEILIKKPRLAPYVSDQVELYVYLFRDKERIRFLVAAISQVERLLTSDLNRYRGNQEEQIDLGAVAKDMASEIQMDFLKKYDKHRSPPDYFYLDAAMTTYLYAYAQTEHLVGKYVAQQAQKDRTSDDDKIVFDEQKYEQKNDHDESETWKDVVRKCLKKLEASDAYCADIMKTRFYNYAPAKGLQLAEVAEELGKSPKAIRRKYEDCFPVLADMVKQEAAKKGLKIIDFLKP